MHYCWPPFFLLLGIFVPLLSSGQEILITYSCTDRPLNEVLTDWEQQYGLSFSYESSLLPRESISLTLQQVELPSALTQLFRRLRITYRVLQERYVILRAAPRHLCGRVLGGEDRVPLPYATILHPATGRGTTTDAQGQFDWPDPPPDTAILTVSYVGYQPKTWPVAELLANGACPTLLLSPDHQRIPEVTVQEFTTDRVTFAEAEDQMQFQPEAIPTLPGWGEPDLMRSLQLLPGIHAIDESAARLSIRGGTPDQNLVLWDHIPIFHSGHFFGLYTAFNPFVVASVDVYRGNYGPEFGGRVAGVLDIHSKSEQLAHARFGAGLNLVNVHTFAEIPLIANQLTLLVAGRRSYTDILQSPTYQNLFESAFQKGRVRQDQTYRREAEEEVQINPDFFYEDYNFKLDWAISHKDQLAWSNYLGRDRLHYRYQEENGFGSHDQLELANAGSSLKYQHHWATGWTTRAHLSWSDYQHDYAYAHQFSPILAAPDFRYRQVNQLTDWTSFVEQRAQVGDQLDIQLGGQYNAQKVYFRYEEAFGSGANEFSTDRLLNATWSVFGQLQWTVDSVWHTHLGVRWDQYTAYDVNAVTLRKEQHAQPRLSIQYQPLEQPWWIRLGWGSYRQYLYQIPGNYTDLGAEEQVWVMADDYFPTITSRQWTLDLHYQKKPWLLDLSVYHKDLSNLSSWQLTLEDDWPNPFVQDGQGQARGLDLLVEYRYRSFRTWMSYSLAGVTHRYKALNRGQYFPAAQDQRHRLTWTHALVLDRWDLSLSWHLQSGRPYTAPEDITTRAEPDGSVDYVLTYTAPHNRRLPVYHRLDVSANYRFQTDFWQGKLGLSIYNLYDRANLLDLDFIPFPPDPQLGETEPSIIGFQQEMLRFTPNLFVQINW